MCRFIAVIGQEEFKVENYIDILEYMAKNGKRSPHKDGWGIWIKNRRGEYIHKETTPIWERKIEDFPKAKILFAHARKKGSGASIGLTNTHPFIRDGAVFMHNGVAVVEHPDVLGDTDSEKLFMHLIEGDVIQKLRELSSSKFSSMNSVLYRDGEIYVIKYARKLLDYYTIFIEQREDRIIISTENLGCGEEIPNKTVLKITPYLNVEYLPIFPDRDR